MSYQLVSPLNKPEFTGTELSPSQSPSYHNRYEENKVRLSWLKTKCWNAGYSFVMKKVSLQFLTNVVQIRCRHRAARPDPIFSPNRADYFLTLKNYSKVRFICERFHVIRATFSSLYWHCLYHKKISFDDFKRIFIFNNIKIYFWKNGFFYIVKI